MSPELAGAKFINLVTFRKDGREVSTPVWFVALDGKLYCYTNGLTGKVKRIRASRRVRIAASDVRGRPLGGWSEGTGRVVEAPEQERRVYEALATKYGLTYWALTFFARLGGKLKERIALELAV
jgi:hypothetical protein